MSLTKEGLNVTFTPGINAMESKKSATAMLAVNKLELFLKRRKRAIRIITQRFPIKIAESKSICMATET